MISNASSVKQPINLRSRRELRMMRKAGLLVWEAHQIVKGMLGEGVNVLELDTAVDRFFAERGAEPTFKGYPGEVPFPAATCISVNEAVVHGIPKDYILKEGDIVGIDTGCRIDGWCGDAAVSYAIGNISPEKQKLLETTQTVLELAIKLMTEKERWSEVAKAMGEFVEQAGFSMVDALSGHGVGREMHEPPQVMHCYNPKIFQPEDDFLLRPGLVLAIEPMVNMGKKQVGVLDDHWTIVAEDGKPSAHFEHTVALTKHGAMRLTGSPDEPDLLSA